MKSIATNSAGMKLSNRRLIVNIIRKKSVSRAELARMTGLTRAAVTLIIDELKKDGILKETGIAETNSGRKPVLLDLDSTCYYAVGVSLTREGCSVGIMNIKGELLRKHKIQLSTISGALKNIEKIINEVKKVINESELPHEKFLGVCISTPGPVDINAGTILNPPNFNMWHHMNIVKEFKMNFRFNVFLENNSTALAIGEKNYGRGSDYRSFMLLVVDTGIGAGIIINENIYRGAGGFGSEVGHTSININGKGCSCGNRGCLETYASMSAVLKKIQKYDRSITTWKMLVSRALNGDETCMKAIEEEAYYLSTGIVNAINILELEAVILTGDIQYKSEVLLDYVRRNVSNAMITRHIRKLHIISSPITNDSEIISSASILFEKFFKGELEEITSGLF